jgi:hypothetical protein
VEFWDSRLSGKKKLSLDENQLILVKDQEHFYHQFKIGDYTFSLNHYDTNTELLINDKNFKQLMKEERSGILDKEKQKHLRKQNHKDIYNNKDYELSDENIYDVDIKEQKRILEEFERKKKKEKEQVKNFYLNDEQMNKVEHNHKNNFVLDDKTVNKNRLIICNIENIFDSGDENEDNDEFNINDFTWDNNTVKLNTFNNNENNIPNFTQNKIEINSNININQINNNINNIHNQNVINQFFDFTKNNTNNNNINYQYPNISNIDNVNDNNIQNKKYNDDFNPFLD